MFDKFSALIQALILFTLSSSTSEGDHDKLGRDNANYDKLGRDTANFTMCWPVPLAISKASPDLGAIFLIKLIIGVLFLSAEGANRRASPFEFATLAVSGSFVR